VDYQGGQGNGSAWYCNDFDAPLLLTSVYAGFQAKPIATINPQDVKDAIVECVPSAEAAPVLNYLKWLLDIVVAVQ
jgi:hypothetical protein